ncbi:MAG TPA: PAS domain S-box protein [Blastocatellia bacterium]
MADEDEEEKLRAVALQNAQTILLARQRAERELIRAKEALEQKTEELAQAKELFQNVFDQAAVGIARVDINGRCLMVNPRLCEMLDYTSEELLSVGISQLLRMDDLAADFEATPRPISSEAPVYRAEKRFLRKDGAVMWVYLTVTVERGKAPAPDKSFIAVIQDITDRKLAEEALRESEYNLRTLADSIPQLACIAGPDGYIFWYNRRWYEYTGATPNEVEGWGWQSFHDAEMLPRVVERWKHSIATGEPFEMEFPLRGKDGRFRWFLTRVNPLRDSQGKITRWFGTSTDINESRKLHEERQRLLERETYAREQAQAATRAKDEFLAVVSHELRHPLSSILGYTRLARANAHDAVQVVRNCEIIERNARMQQRLIEDLLDTARIISGKLKIEAAPTDLRLVLEDALAVVRPAAEAKQIDLVARLGDEPQRIIGDAARLQQVVWNLLQNAIKFTPEGGRVELRMEQDGQRVRLIVSDTGQGIEPEFLPAVFDRFSQSDMSRARRHGGLGLGLSLVKQLVELHGGMIEVSSPGVKQGATFTVTLPMSAPQVATYLQPTPAVTEVRAGPEAMPLIDLPRLDGVRALVVDDQEEARRLVAATLGEWGAVVTTAASGAEARTIMTNAEFDVLVCDIAMPGEDGYEVISRIRTLETQRGAPSSERLPAIALTALARPEDRMQALEAGFQMHVAKPVELAELVVVIESLIRRI